MSKGFEQFKPVIQLSSVPYILHFSLINLAKIRALAEYPVCRGPHYTVCFLLLCFTFLSLAITIMYVPGIAMGHKSDI